MHEILGGEAVGHAHRVHFMDLSEDQHDDDRDNDNDSDNEQQPAMHFMGLSALRGII